MSRKTNPVQLLWHVAGAIHQITEVITKIQTDNYSEAVHHAIKASGHLVSLVMGWKTLKTAGELIWIRARRFYSRLYHQLRNRIRSQQSRHDDDR